MNGDVKTKIIKRNGEEVTFDLDKIINAITKANEEVTKIQIGRAHAELQSH